jgi:hypothetical protein
MVVLVFTYGYMAYGAEIDGSAGPQGEGYGLYALTAYRAYHLVSLSLTTNGKIENGVGFPFNISMTAPMYSSVLADGVRWTM